MNIRISLPSGVNEGENLPLAASFSAPGMRAPVLECGFSAHDSRFDLRSAGEGWQGVTNVHSALAGHAFLKFRLSDPSRPGREWRGEVSVRFSQRQQAAPIHFTGVSNQGEKSGMGQANSVNITVNGLGASGGGAAASEPSWQSVELMLHECDAAVTIPASPLPAPVSPVSPAYAKRTPYSPLQPEDPAAISPNLMQKPHETMSDGWSKKLVVTVSVAGILGVIATVVIFAIKWNAPKPKEEPPKPQPIIFNNINGIGNSIQGGQSMTTPSPIPVAPIPPRSDDPVLDGPKAAQVPPVPTPPAAPSASVRPQGGSRPAPQFSLPGDDGGIEVRGMAAVYQSGAALRFEVRLTKPGYLRLQTCDPAGAAIQLYPCQHDAIKEHPAGQWISLPDPGLLAKFPNATYECYVPDGKTRETTRVRLQWSPFPFEPTGMRGAGEFFYEPSQPATWGDLATRGVRLNLNKPAVESKEMTFEVVKP